MVKIITPSIHPEMIAGIHDSMFDDKTEKEVQTGETASCFAAAPGAYTPDAPADKT